ncbi:MAG: SGNH/GDSL hydrolase family protein [Anaerolineae bacterium]|nr:SGNH/GDSL hydrolase family protein [Anaerolineae bacterium]
MTGKNNRPFRFLRLPWVQNLGLAIVAVLLTLVLLEIALRLFPVKSMVYMESREPFYVDDSSEWGYRYPSNPRGYFDEDNSVIFYPNSLGFRDEEFQPSIPPGTLRITLLGDSFAYGEGVWLEDTAAYRMEALLSEQVGCPVEVYNFASSGTSFDDYLEIYEEQAAAFDTDLLVIWYFLNDVETGGTLGYLGADIARYGRHLPRLRQHSALIDLLATGLDTRSSTQDMIDEYNSAYLPESERWQTVVDDMDRLAQLAARNETPVVLFVHPVLFHLDDSYPFTAIHQKVIEAAGSAGITAYDLFPAFEGETGETLWVHPVDQHPNEIGHAIAAEYAADRIAPLLPDCP